MSLSPGVTMLLATALWTFLRALLFGSAAIALENLALRHQTGRPAASRRPPPAHSMGPDLLGLALPPVGELAVQSRHRSAGYGLGLAPERLPALLAVEVPGQPGRPPEARP
jgi:hypothetical protein